MTTETLLTDTDITTLGALITDTSGDQIDSLLETIIDAEGLDTSKPEHALYVSRLRDEIAEAVDSGRLIATGDREVESFDDGFDIVPEETEE